MSLSNFNDRMLPAIEIELKRFVARLDEPRTRIFHEMLTYHMGWSGAGSGPEATGKRIRPLLVLLTCAAMAMDNSNLLKNGNFTQGLNGWRYQYDLPGEGWYANNHKFVSVVAGTNDHEL